MHAQSKRTHPASTWAATQHFDRVNIDCTTTVVLKILDGKCKMSSGEKAAIMEIYDVVQDGSGVLFDSEVHQIIAKARRLPDTVILKRIHILRLYAEEKIPRPVMKAYKAMLRDGLFG